MKLSLLDVENFTKNLNPVTTTELRTRTGDFHPEGLFSENIFGVEGSLDRSKTFSYINLNTYVIHPSAFMLLTRLDKKRITSFFSTEDTYSLDKNGNLVQDNNGVTGIRAFIDLFPKITFRGGTSTRDQIIKVLKENYKNGTLFINKIIVIPPDFRPMYEDESGTWIIDELNNIYVNILRKASQIKSIGTGSGLFDLLNYYLQTTINDHDKYIRTRINKKSGLIRGNLLGKRVDFSARGVITPGPDLKVNEIGLPLRMAVSLFQPFLFHYILFSKKYPYLNELEKEVLKFTESELSVESLQRVLKSIKTNDKVPSKLEQMIFDATEIVMKGRVILAKRDPALHDGSYKAFYPKLINGSTIQLCTLVVSGFNADFDGDQMAIFHPLTKQSQEEAITKMMRGAGSKHSGHITYELSKEMALGLYTMTKPSKRTSSPIGVSNEDLEKATDPFIPVKFRNQNTTMGRAIVNNAFPPDFPFVDKIVTKKIINNLIPDVIEKYGDDVAIDVFSKLEKIGFKFATIIASSITLDMIEMPDEILRMKDKLKDSSPEEANRLLNQMEKIMINHLKDTGLYDLVESGAGKGWGQPRQILIAKGIIADPKGNLLPPIKGSFSDGLSNVEYFEAASGARKGLADRTLNTADTGYFTRQLVYVLSPAEAHPSLRDCKTKRTITIRLTADIIRRLTGRYIVRGNKVVKFNANDFKVGDVINLRSPIFCESMKICHTCYGDLLRRHRTPYVGILAGASIGERGTQLIMQTFHTGGAASVAEYDIVQDIIDNDPLLEVDAHKYLKQEDNKLIVKKPCKITLDLTNYNLNDNIQINNSNVWVNHLVSKIEFEDTIFNILLDYPIELQKINMEKDKFYLTLSYNTNDMLLSVPFQSTHIKEQVNYVGRLLGGRVIYKDPSHMISKILKIYGGKVSNLDLVHFEVLISQVLRDKTNKALPARLGKKWDPVMMNIKTTVFQSGFVQGLAFENINAAIETGLITEDIMPPSLLARLVTGDLTEQ